MQFKLTGLLFILLAFSSCKQMVSNAIEDKVLENQNTEETTSKASVEKTIHNIPIVYFYEDTKDKKGLAKLIRQQVENDKKPIVYFTATWCKPCKQFKESLSDPLMQTAFEDAVIIEIDIDNDDEDYAARYGVRAIPAFIKLDEKGTLLNKINGGAWEANTAKNMAPVLETFIQSTES